jgi:glycosyltransferase involved in cell wall biosynthesis
MQQTPLVKSPALSVIVPARNAAATLPACLAALAASVGAPHEVIVVDDASSDGTAAIAARAGARVVALGQQSGAAIARNAGARHADGDLLFFTDADVLVRPDTLARALAAFRDHPGISAVFGSYTAETVHQNFCSVYKNMIHHVTHQQARPEAMTFWSGAGAIRADAFWAVGGFDPRDTTTADVEDIALGYRLRRAGHTIRLDREIQATHAKHYSLIGMIRSDLLHRAIPWMRLMLRERIYQRDLNTNGSSLVSVVVVLGFALALLGSLLLAPLALVAVALLVLFGLLNRRFLATFARAYPRFAPLAVPMTMLYFAYAALGGVIGVALHLWLPARPAGAAHAQRDPARPAT